MPVPQDPFPPQADSALRHGRLCELQDGEILFREGDPGVTVFMVERGEIEIVKEGDGSAFRLAVLGPGQILGEMAVLDDQPRTATARALGPAAVRMLGRSSFMLAIKDEPRLAYVVMCNLVERLRRMDDAAATQWRSAIDDPTIGGRVDQIWNEPGYLGHLFGRQAAFGERTDAIEFQIARLNGDRDGTVATRLCTALETVPGARAFRLDEAIPTDVGITPTMKLAWARDRARALLARSRSGLVVWGDVRADGRTVTLRFAPPGVEDDDRPGGFSLASRLEVPVDFDAPTGHLIAAVALAATLPVSEGHHARLSELLPPTLLLGRPAALRPPAVLDDEGQSALRSCYGNACAVVGARAGGVQWYDMAVRAYRSALQSIRREEAVVDWGLLQKQLGKVLFAMARRRDGTDALDAAARAFDHAMQSFTAKRYPLDWASVQNKLGSVLLTIDARAPDDAVLDRAVTAFRNALSVWTREQAPHRWSEATHNLGQALQTQGLRRGSLDLLDEAIAASSDALTVRTRETAPVFWAATANNLAASRFHRGRLAGDRIAVAAALDDARAALEIFRQSDAPRMARVVESNLALMEDALAAMA